MHKQMHPTKCNSWQA